MIFHDVLVAIGGIPEWVGFLIVIFAFVIVEQIYGADGSRDD